MPLSSLHASPPRGNSRHSRVLTGSPAIMIIAQRQRQHSSLPSLSILSHGSLASDSIENETNLANTNLRATTSIFVPARNSPSFESALPEQNIRPSNHLVENIGSIVSHQEQIPQNDDDRSTTVPSDTSRASTSHRSQSQYLETQLNQFRTPDYADGQLDTVFNGAMNRCQQQSFTRIASITTNATSIDPNSALVSYFPVPPAVNSYRPNRMALQYQGVLLGPPQPHNPVDISTICRGDTSSQSFQNQINNLPNTINYSLFITNISVDATSADVFQCIATGKVFALYLVCLQTAMPFKLQSWYSMEFVLRELMGRLRLAMMRPRMTLGLRELMSNMDMTLVLDIVDDITTEHKAL
ncbi:hypothetical protein B0J14DRAFT_638656 [Halenospora varia]|nr:hypothetical protein B0J14DRAFT_638656 [Halenospora varia]